MINDQIDRVKLGRLVFSDPDALESLEKVVHPLVGQAVDILIRRSRQEVVVVEAIKLIEAGLAKKCDSLWVTYAPQEQQIARLVQKRGMPEASAIQRIQAFVLKIANATEELSLLEAQNQVMERVTSRETFFPNIVASLRGEKVESVSTPDGVRHFVRLVTYLPGMPMGKVKRQTPGLLFDLGQKLGRLDRALQDFDHPALHRDFYWDLSHGLKVSRKNLKLVKDKELRAMVVDLAAKFKQFTTPLVPNLRKTIIYNDANDYNVLVGGGDDLIQEINF